MNGIVLFEDEGFRGLLPLLFWRSVFEVYAGRSILLDRAAERLAGPISGVWTRDWMAAVAAQRCGALANAPITGNTSLVNGRWLMDKGLALPDAPCVGVAGDQSIAYVICDANLAGRLKAGIMADPEKRGVALAGVPRRAAGGGMVRYPWEVIGRLKDLLAEDWNPADASIGSELPLGVALEPKERIHVGERVQIHPTSRIDGGEGSVFIGDDVSIGAFAVIEGPIFIGSGSRIHPHAWLHGGNVIGPVCKVGGEVRGCVLSGYVNKQHAGYLGHAYVGCWVNIGAGACNSDLKNTYGSVRVPINGTDVDSGERFFGAIIADHAKIGINAAIPTGAVIGVGASIASSGPIPKYIPSFGWVASEGLSRGDHCRSLDVATRVMARRNVDMTDEEVELFLELGARVRQFESWPRTKSRDSDHSNGPAVLSEFQSS